MNGDFQLVGKTITGVIATPGTAGGPRNIWMLQFSDGTHVEFVSATARRRLRAAARAQQTGPRTPNRLHSAETTAA